MSDWLFDSLVFSLLTARKRVNKDGCRWESFLEFSFDRFLLQEFLAGKGFEGLSQSTGYFSLAYERGHSCKGREGSFFCNVTIGGQCLVKLVESLPKMR